MNGTRRAPDRLPGWLGELRSGEAHDGEAGRTADAIEPGETVRRHEDAGEAVVVEAADAETG
jgi:hypothetical protein